MKTLVFAVQEPRRPELVVEVQAERILLGSGAHCDIRLPLESAAWEHVVVTQEADSVVARVIPTDGTAFFNGEARRDAELVPGSSIRVDSVVITLRDVTTTEVKKQKESPLRAVAIVVGGLVLGAAMMIFKSASAGGTPPPPTAPDPIANTTASCPEKQGALPLAHQKLALARSKRERFRFYPRDGVEAVTHYGTARACFESAGDKANAAISRDEAATVQREVRESFHASRVRLERALVRKDAFTALEQVKFQRDLLSGTPEGDEYLTWLALLQSKLESLIAQAK